MKLSISHDTSYRYQDQVRASIQYLRLTPQQSQRQHASIGSLSCPDPCVHNVIPTETSCMC